MPHPNYKLITGPTADEECVHPSDFENWSQDTTNGQTAIYGEHIPSARETVEDWVDKRLTTQVWEYYLDAFPPWDIELQYGPWQALDPTTMLAGKPKITYLDENGASQTLATTSYQFDAIHGRLSPEPDEDWPSTETDRYNAVTIRFVSGFGARTVVPKKYKTAIQALVLDWVTNRALRYKMTDGVKEILRLAWDGDY